MEWLPQKNADILVNGIKDGVWFYEAFKIMSKTIYLS